VKVGILAGGYGTRLSEETERRPKPMVEIGGQPIIWHIMHSYARFGYRNFVIACGYRSDFIKRWFADAATTTGDVRVDFGTNSVEPMGSADALDWTVDLVDTGLKTATGGRIKRLQPWLGGETCMITWGDGLSDLDIDELLAFHRSHGKLATLTAVRPPARFGAIELDGNQVIEFSEKPQTGEGWINGAFFVLEPEVFDYIEGDATMFEREPLEQLAADGELMAYRHDGFWQCMDTLRDKRRLEQMWESGAPWLPAGSKDAT